MLWRENEIRSRVNKDFFVEGLTVRGRLLQRVRFWKKKKRKTWIWDWYLDDFQVKITLFSNDFLSHIFGMEFVLVLSFLSARYLAVFNWQNDYLECHLFANTISLLLFRVSVFAKHFFTSWQTDILQWQNRLRFLHERNVAKYSQKMMTDFYIYLCRASNEGNPAFFINCCGSGRPGILGLEETAGRPAAAAAANGGGSPPAPAVCDKNAACAAWAAAGWFRAMNCAAIGFRPGGPGGPKPLPNGDLSSRGSGKERKEVNLCMSGRSMNQEEGEEVKAVLWKALDLNSCRCAGSKFLVITYIGF